MATMEYIGSQPPLHRPPLAKPNGEGPLPWPTLPDELPLLLEVVALRNHREVMCFLRSLMRNHNLRARVRRLGYVCLARIDNKNRRIPEAAPTSKGPMVEDPSSWPITGPDRAMINMFHLGAKDMINSLDATQKALAVILAMLPRVEALFLTHGANEFGSLWPSFDMEQDPVARLLNPPLQSLATLEDIIVDSHSNTWTLWFLILNCRHLRRVVLKGPVKFDAKVSLREWRINQLDSAEIESQRPPMMQQVQLLSRAAVGNIQELSLYKSRTVKWDIIPKIFPDLKRLSTVFADTGWRDAFWSDDWTSRQPVRLPDAFGQVIALYKSSLRSLTVTDALSDNEWTSGEGRRWDSSSTAFFYVAPIPPLLSPGLAQVPLVELTTDCAWLFGRDDTTISYQISSLLPSSLVSLHLIDYWAVSVYEEGGRLLIPPGAVVDQVPDEPRNRFKKIDYYRIFSSGLTPLEFLGKVFATLHESCADQHTQLKQITLLSPMFDEKGRWSRTTARPAPQLDWFRSYSDVYGMRRKPLVVDRAEVQAWQAKVGDDFAKIGVRFSFTSMRELRKSMKSSWACA